MTFKSRCRHGVVAGTLCTLCVGLPVAKPLLETRPETTVVIMGSNQRMPENDNPNEPAGGLFFQQPIQASVTTSSIAQTPIIPHALKLDSVQAEVAATR